MAHFQKLKGTSILNQVAYLTFKAWLWKLEGTGDTDITGVFYT